MSAILIDGATITVLPETTRAMVVHDAADCAGRTCVVHAPTEHPMRHLPLQWRADRGIFERRCEHGVGHPDPDQRAYWREYGERHAANLRELAADAERDRPLDIDTFDPAEYVAAQMVHGCCGRGCCS